MPAMSPATAITARAVQMIGGTGRMSRECLDARETASDRDAQTNATDGDKRA